MKKNIGFLLILAGVVLCFITVAMFPHGNREGLDMIDNLYRFIFLSGVYLMLFMGGGILVILDKLEERK